MTKKASVKIIPDKTKVNKAVPSKANAMPTLLMPRKMPIIARALV